MNIRIGRVSKILSPGYRHCERCKTTWAFVKWHTTWYEKTVSSETGYNALCEKCWNELNPKERWEYYKLSMWRNCSDLSKWDKVKEAVLKGL